MAEIDNLELLLSEIDLLKTELQLQNTLQDAQWKQTLATENTHRSNSLEGSSLTLRETEMVIRTGLMLPGKPMAENLLALNHYQAVQSVRQQAADQTLLSEELLRQIFLCLLKGIDRQQNGHYRSRAADLANGQAAPVPEQLNAAMAELYRWAHSEGTFLHPIVFGAEIHLRLQTLKPFPTANGLCARLAMNLILLEEGYPLLSIASDENSRTAYYAALAGAQSGRENLDAWYCFIAKQALQTWQNLLQRLQNQEDDIA